MKEIVIDLEVEKNEILKRYRALLRACKSTLEKGDKRMIRKAFDMALESHAAMRRKSGEPYIYHPIAVAQIAAEEIGLGTTSIVCACCMMWLKIPMLRWMTLKGNSAKK